MPYLIDVAKAIGMNDLSVFQMTADEWDCLAKLFPELARTSKLCKAFIDYIKEICEVLNEKNWFGAPARMPQTYYTFEYCKYYPQCDKCSKGDINAWTPDVPDGLPPINPTLYPIRNSGSIVKVRNEYDPFKRDMVF